MPLVIRKRNPDGSFGNLVNVFKRETESDKIERLEATNAQLAYEAIEKDLKIEELSNNQAELTYQLMMKGVL